MPLTVTQTQGVSGTVVTSGGTAQLQGTRGSSIALHALLVQMIVLALDLLIETHLDQDVAQLKTINKGFGLGLSSL